MRSNDKSILFFFSVESHPDVSETHFIQQLPVQTYNPRKFYDYIIHLNMC